MRLHPGSANGFHPIEWKASDEPEITPASGPRFKKRRKKASAA
jgi:hypothetical protein